MTFYRRWGFYQSPFSTKPLPATAVGASLLVGRDDDLARLLTRLHNPPRIPTIEGANGIGKTSLVNVAAYRSLAAYLDRPETALLIPCSQLEDPLTISELDAGNIDDFEFHVYTVLAQTLVERRADLEKMGRATAHTKALDRWLNSPRASAIQASIAGLGGLGGSSSNSSTKGFDASGFKRSVRAWLNEIFPDEGSGGIVCVLDNLELLGSSAAAKTHLERLRDSVLSIPGTRWVMCGAQGIIRSVASTPRLHGVLYDPMELRAIAADDAKDVFEKRVSAFAMKDDPYLPLVADDFVKLDRVLNLNTRDALGYADDYCLWVAEALANEPHQEQHKSAWFADWLRDESVRVLKDVSVFLNEDAQMVLRVACAKYSGTIRYESFLFDPLVMTQSIADVATLLIKCGLAQEQHGADGTSHALAVVTPKGWLTDHARKSYSG